MKRRSALPWSSVRDTMIDTRAGLVPVRYVACVCPKCWRRNRVLVHDGGRVMSRRDVEKVYGCFMQVRLYKDIEENAPVWTAGTKPGGLAICGICSAPWSASVHTNSIFTSRDTPVPLPDPDADGHPVFEDVQP